MKHRLKIISVLAVITLIAGCAGRRPGSTEIDLRYSKKGLDRCTFLGKVRGAEHMVGGVLAAVAHRNARVRMINKAVLMGADTLYVQGRHFWWFGASSWGDAYKCDGVQHVQQHSSHGVEDDGGREQQLEQEVEYWKNRAQQDAATERDSREYQYQRDDAYCKYEANRISRNAMANAMSSMAQRGGGFAGGLVRGFNAGNAIVDMHQAYDHCMRGRGW